MKKLKDNWIVDLSVTTVLLGLMCYAAYSLWYIFDGTLSSGDVHLYTALTSVALGWFMMIFTKTIIEKATWFLVGSLVVLCICTSFINFEKEDASSIVTEMKTTLPTPAALPGQEAAAPAPEAAPVAPAENN